MFLPNKIADVSLIGVKHWGVFKKLPKVSPISTKQTQDKNDSTEREKGKKEEKMTKEGKRDESGGKDRRIKIHTK